LQNFREEDLNFLRRAFIYFADKIVGVGGFQIALTLLSNGDLTDEEISELTGIPITTVRNILITLQNLGLLTLIKEKQKNTNWINYYWHVEPLAVKRFLRDRLRESIINLKRLNEQLKEDEFYECLNCGMVFSRDEVEETDFKCKVCGAEVQPFEFNIDLDPLIKELADRLKGVK